jgi:hypothetical protein
MGQSTNAVLAYGYDLGGDEGGWKIKGAGEYDELPKIDWYDDSEDNDDGFVEQAEKRLLAQIAGFTEKWEQGAEGYFARAKAAEERVGVEFESYCSGDYPMYVLAAHVITVHRGGSKLIDPNELLAQPETEGWDAKLAAAIKALGITPTQVKPGWVLVSYWG